MDLPASALTSVETSGPNERESLLLAEMQLPPLRVTVQREKKLGVLQVAGRGSIRDVLLQQIDRHYPDRFDKFEKLARNQLMVGGDQMDIIEFTYDSPTGTTKIYQWLGLVVRNTDAYFISVQCPIAEERNVRPLATHMLQSVRLR